MGFTLIAFLHIAKQLRQDWKPNTFLAFYTSFTAFSVPKLKMREKILDLRSPWQRRGPTVSLASDPGRFVSPTATWLTGKWSLYTRSPESSLLRKNIIFDQYKPTQQHVTEKTTTYVHVHL